MVNVSLVDLARGARAAEEYAARVSTRLAPGVTPMSIQGFDYVTMTKLAHPRERWRELLDNVISNGGRRRVEKGETFAHDARGQLLFEVYANIPAKEVVADVSDLL